MTAAHYVQDGLVACWDGIENAGAGVHADSLSQWVDLVGGRSFTPSNPTVGARAIRFSGASDSYGVLSAANTTAGAQVFFDRVRASGERGAIRVTVKAAGLRAAEACLSV